MAILLTSPDDDSILTEQEVKIASKTLAGISEMLNFIMSHTPKDYAEALCGDHRQSTKSRTRTAVLDYYINNEERHHGKEPHHILQELPANLQNIDGSDFTDTLKQFCRTFFLQNIRDKPKEDRGRPEKPSYEETDLGGRYSSYQSSHEYLEQVVHTLKKPEVGRIIDELLLEDGLLYKYQRYKNEILYYLVCICEEEKFWNVVKDFRYIDVELSKKSSKEIEAFFNKIKGLDGNEVESEVEKATRLSLLRPNNNDNIFIYVIAGVISMANMF